MFMRSQDCKKGILAMVKWPNLRRFMAKFAQLMAYFYFIFCGHFKVSFILQGVSVKVTFSPSMLQGLNLIKYW